MVILMMMSVSQSRLILDGHGAGIWMLSKMAKQLNHLALDN